MSHIDFNSTALLEKPTLRYRKTNGLECRRNNLLRVLRHLAVPGLLMLGADRVSAQIFSNAITDPNPSAANPFTAGQTVAANMTVTGIGRGSGINANSGSNRYNATAWNLSGFDANDYFTWTMTPDAGFELDLTSFVYTAQRSSSGPLSYAFRSSLDGYTTNIGTPTQTGTTISLSSFQDITTPITFRLYGWGGSNASGTYSINDFSFNGSVNVAVSTAGAFWDTNGATAGIGGTGTWSTTETNWATTDAGTDSGIYSPTATTIFGGVTAGTVTVDGTVAPQLGLTFKTDGYIVTGGTEIQLAGATPALNTITTDPAVNATINTPLTGSSGLTKAGDGTLTLGGANTFSGATEINAGKLSLSAGDVLPDSSDVTVTAAEFNVGTHSDTVGIVTLTSGSITGTTGTLTGSAYELKAGRVSAKLAGAGTLTKSTAGTVTLAGENAYTGDTNLQAGTLALDHVQALGTTSTLRFTGATLKYGPNNNVDYSSRISTEGAQQFKLDTNGANVTFASPLTSAGGTLQKSGAGTLTLAAANNYDGGTTISDGTLKLTHDAGAGTGTVMMAQGNFFAGAGRTVSNPIVVGTAAVPPTIGTLVDWNFGLLTAADNFGASPYAPLTVAAGVTTSGLVRGTGVATSGVTAAARAWGGVGFNSADANAAIAANKFVTMTVSSANDFSLTEIDVDNIRHSSTGSTLGQWQYQIGSDPFVDIGGVITWGPETGGAGNLQEPISLTEIAALQNLSAGTVVTLRVVPFGGTGTTGTWYFNDPAATLEADLAIKGQTTVTATGSGTIGIDEAGTAIFTGGVTTNSNATLSAVTGGTARFEGVGITGAGNVIKAEAGKVILAADNSFTGNTTINAGTLALETTGTNNIAASPKISLASGTAVLDVTAVAGGFTLASGQTLAGVGSVLGNVNAGSGAIVAPGLSSGTLTLSTGLDLSGGGTYTWDIATTSTTGVGINSDLILVNGGDLVLGGSSTLALDFSQLATTGPDSADAFWTAIRSWKIIDVAAGLNLGSTSFDSLTNGTFSSGSFATSVGSGADAGDIFLTFTPGTLPSGPAIWTGTSGSAWSTGSSWTGTVPNANTAEAVFSTTGGAVADLDSNQTVNKLTFDLANSYTIGSLNNSTLSTSGTAPTITTAATNTGTQTVAVNLDLAAGTTVAVNGGTLELNSPANAVLGAGVTATVATGATLSLGGAGNALSNGTSTHANVANSGTLAATTAGKRVGEISGSGTTTVTTAGATLTANHIRQSTLNIGAGNTVTVAANGGNTGTSVVTNLNINATGKLDLNDNDLVVDNGNLATLTAQLATGLDINGTYGNGPGITSTAFANNVDFNTVLGIAANVELGYTSFSGQTVDANDILIKYTYYGDADLSGSVDTSTDFDLYITGLTSGGSLGGWLYGDFDYSGTVDSSTDFDLYITGLTSQGSPLLTAGGGGNLVQAVPEPSTFVLGGLALLGFAGVGLRKRRLQ